VVAVDLDRADEAKGQLDIPDRVSMFLLVKIGSIV
jgi:hypothetical protein